MNNIELMESMRQTLESHEAHKNQVFLKALCRRLGGNYTADEIMRPEVRSRLKQLIHPDRRVVLLDGVPLVEFTNGKFENSVADGVQRIKFVAQYKDYTLL